jgi:hypothetical protein
MNSADLVRMVHKAASARIAEDRRAMFTPADIKQDIEAALVVGVESVSEQSIKDALQRLWGTGIEPKALGGALWGAGYSRPPVSREIRPPLR